MCMYFLILACVIYMYIHACILLYIYTCMCIYMHTILIILHYNTDTRACVQQHGQIGMVVSGYSNKSTQCHVCVYVKDRLPTVGPF